MPRSVDVPVAIARLGEALADRWSETRTGGPGDFPGLFVGIQGVVNACWCFGVANPATGASWTEATCLPMLSMAKPLTTLGALRLCELGRVSLRTHLCDVFSTDELQAVDFAGHDPRHVTLERLLTHSAGFAPGSYADLPPRAKAPSVAEIIAGAARLKARLVAPPGERHIYSTVGTTMVEWIIERVTGAPFGPWMREEVLGPLGAEDLWFAPTQAFRDRCAPGHDEEGRVVALRRNLSRSSSGVYGAPVACARALAHGFVLPNRLFSAGDALRPRGVDAEGHHWGLGVTIDGRGGEPMFRHGGWRKGWWTFGQGFPDRGVVYILSSNGLAFRHHARRFGMLVDQAVLQLPRLKAAAKAGGGGAGDPTQVR